ncbi:histidine phosphatase family protein [Aestuariicoccus sp. MJ-SS9]|uniref:histidine phosphatase family protein n=1 Tax=Aestuariicoccus sp. MJ-SS9 TaxID=3079855 RepID=UPI00290DEF5C|nr:histidine phosphatase family protein [Aestuariicoccus sp. MJ-SS9]MDU8911820.1 histidine phosphatase family protein [Aestuariicoccus sp. MJ-SS9]
MDRRTVIFGGVALLAGCGAASGPLRLAPGTTLYVTRHGDRDGEDLSDRGRARAQALTGALAALPLDAIYSPGIQRNLDTAAPIAAARSLPVQHRPQENPTARLVRDSAGGHVLWVGNKGNITAIWEALALPTPPPLDYGDLAIVRSDAEGRVTVERRRYGPE